MSPPFLSPRGEGSRCTICTACSAFAPLVTVLDNRWYLDAAFLALVALCDQVAALLKRIQRQGNIKFAPQSRFHADFNVVVIDKHGDVQFFLHQFWFIPGALRQCFKVRWRLAPAVASGGLLYRRPDEVDNCFERRTGLEHSRDAQLL